MFKYLIIACSIPILIYSAPISLEEAINVALVNNIDIKTSTTAIEKSIEQRREAWSYVMPKLNTSVNYSRTESFQTKQFSELFSGAGFGDVTQESYTYNLKLTQPLFSGEARPYIKASALDILIQENDLDKTQQTVMFTVLSGYLAALSAYDQVALSEESLSVLKSEHKTVTAKFDEGLINKTVYLQSKLAIESESLTLLQSEKAYRIALANLKTLLNLDSDTSFSVMNVDLHNDVTPTFNVSEKISDAFKYRDDIENAAFQIRILELVALSQHRQK